MDSKEFGEWIAYEQLEPGESPIRADVRSAIIAKTVSDMHQVKGKPRPIEDFMPNIGRAAKPQKDLQEMKMTFKHISAMHNRKLEKQRGSKDGNNS